MVFACCFGGGGGDVDAKRKLNTYAASAEQVIIGKTGKEFEHGETTKTGAAYLSGNTASLSAVTSTGNSSVAYQLNLLSSALAGLSGTWYERVSSAAARLINVSGAALCSVSILDAGHNKFTFVHVTGKDPDCAAICPMGSRLPALQAVAASAAHHPAANGILELRYNSLQVLQLLQTPLLYSFSDPIHGSREMKQPPYDWQAVYGAQGLVDFCALPLMHEKSVVGAVTLIFKQPLPPPAAGPGLGGPGRPAPPGSVPQQRNGGSASATGAYELCCDEQAMQALGLLLSVLLAGQDLRLAQQVGDLLARVHEARNLQQVVAAVAAGAERVLQLRTRVAVSVNLAVLPGQAAAAAAGGLAQPPAAGGRAIFFEERGAGAGGGGWPATGGSGGGMISRSMPSTSELMGSGGSQGNGVRARIARTNSPMDDHGSSGGGGGGAGTCPGASPLGRLEGGGLSGGGAATAPPGFRAPAGVGVSSHDGVTGASCSNGAVLWQASSVQARALGLRHTLLANLPAAGTVVHDCASYMQQVGFPKRDLYLLSACNGVPPFALVIAPAPLPAPPSRRGGGEAASAGASGDAGGAQMVLYVAVGMRLPMELLQEILTQAHQLAVRIIAPLLGCKLAQPGLAEEWALLVNKCMASRGGGGVTAEAPLNSRASSSTHGAATASTASTAGARGCNTAGVGGGRGGSARAGDNRSAADASTPGGEAGTGGDGEGGSSGSSRGERGRGLAADGGGAMEAAATVAIQPPPPQSGDEAGVAASRAGGRPHSLPDAGPSRVLAADTSRESRETVLSTVVAGTFAGDTRTHMGMLVSLFKDTINALQAFRSEEAEELSVLKLGKVLGRGGSGLVFQGYLHMGLEVAVKLFENPDDTDPDPEPSALEHGTRATAQDLEAPSTGGEADGGSSGAAAAAADAAAAVRRSASKNAATAAVAAAAQMTKRQRDLMRNALELGVTSSLSHPNIVQGYCHWVNVVLMQDASLNRCWLMGQAEYTALAPPGSPPPPLCSALVMEYCDMGSLIHALKRGTFSTPDGKPNMEFVYMCLLEIALALRHLHTAKLAHFDLKPGNVLLRSSPRDPRGFVCKLADFGYAAILKDGLLPGRPAVLPEEACGTLQYMAPELFVAGRPVDASIDIYAFGMLMWELITGRTPYSENDYPSRSLMKSVYHGKRPGFPDHTITAYKNLAMCCWSGDPNMRPSASVLVKLLRQQLESLKQHSSNTNTNSTSTTGSRA